MDKVALLAALALVAVALAGCSDGGGKEPPLVDVKPTQAGKGAIGGVVVDEAIRPIAGAVVELQGAGLNATTDEKGVFSWPDLEPGTYFIATQADRFLSVQSSAEVRADETTFVRILLAGDPAPLPYQVTYQHNGFMQAWAGIAQFFLEAQDENGSALCDCRLSFTPEANLSKAVYEAFWEWTLPDPADLDELYYVVEQIGGDAYASGYCYSPCRVEIDGADFTPNVQAYARLDGPDLYVAYQQKFQLFVTLFYNGDPPAGWTIAEP